MWLTVSEKAAAVDVFDASVQSFTPQNNYY